MLIVPDIENLWCDICDLVEAPRVILGTTQRTPKGYGIGRIPVLAQAVIVSAVAAVLFDDECVRALLPSIHADRARIIESGEPMGQFSVGNGMDRG